MVIFFHLILPWPQSPGNGTGQELELFAPGLNHFPEFMLAEGWISEMG